jgi:hypothetical protein
MNCNKARETPKTKHEAALPRSIPSQFELPSNSTVQPFSQFQQARLPAGQRNELGPFCILTRRLVPYEEMVSMRRWRIIELLVDLGPRPNAIGGGGSLERR